MGYIAVMFFKRTHVNLSTGTTIWLGAFRKPWKQIRTRRRQGDFGDSVLGFRFGEKSPRFFEYSKSWLWKMNPQKKVANMMKIMMWFEATKMTCYMTWTSIGEWRQACGDLSQIGLGRRRMSSTNQLFIHRAGSFSLRRSGWKRIVTDTDTTYSLIWVYLKIIENPQNASGKWWILVERTMICGPLVLRRFVTYSPKSGGNSPRHQRGHDSMTTFLPSGFGMV